MRRHNSLTIKKLAIAVALVCSGSIAASFAGAQPAVSSPTRSRVLLTPCHADGVREELRCGAYRVFENRRLRTGRMLTLKLVLIPARHPHPDQGPIFYLAGGPGETATELASFIIELGDNEEHDVVLLDERGTSDGNRLECRSPGSDNNLGAYLKGPFDPAVARSCRKELEQHYDLTQYTTAAFVEDLEDVRQAMGYDKINLDAGSFGTYAALMYIRSHGEHVRSAYLSSLVTLSNRVPLFHAQSAQHALDQLFSQCDHDTACHDAYPRLRDDFAAVLARVREKPARTWIRHPVTGARTEILLPEPAFADAVRVMMYSSQQARELPFLIEKVKAGDFSPFAEAAVHTSRDFYSGVRMGLHYAITCNEFVSRIRPDEVPAATRGSYLDAWRVRDQMAACEAWPKTDLPEGYLRPFRSKVPAVLVSGDTDPAAPPRWGEEVKSFMTNAVHLIVPGGGHTPDNACTRSIRNELFRTGSTHGLDLSCMAKLRPAPFKLP